MKKKIIVCLIAIVAITAVVIFSGCVEETELSTPTSTPPTYLIIQKFGDTNRNSRIDNGDERLSGREFKVTYPDGKTTTHTTNDMGEIRIKIIKIPREYEGKDYTFEEILKPNWKPVFPIKQTVKVPEGKTTTVQFLNMQALMPAPTPTLTPTILSISITAPKDGDNVSWRYMVEGFSSATEDSGLSVYVLIWPLDAGGPWYAQPTTTFSDGSWQSNAYFGRNPDQHPEDIGSDYRVAAILTTQKLSTGQSFEKIPREIQDDYAIVWIEVTRTI